MEELLVCRVCLVTDVKLFDMFQCKLAESYQIITGTEMSVDGLPIHICSICAALLQKSVSFKNKCHNAQHILRYSSLQTDGLTTAYLRTIDRNLHSLTFPLIATTLNDTIDIFYEIKEETYNKDNAYNISVKYESDEEPLEIKEGIYNEDLDIDTADNVSVKYESDEEPLAKKVKKKRKKKFKIEDEIKLKNDNDCDDIVSENDKNIDEINELEGLNDVQVLVLSKEEQIDEVVLRKNSFNYLNSFYKCDKCYKGFITDSTFKNHMSRHEPSSGPHACEICLTRWPTARSLRAHVVTSHERKYVCRKCNHVSKSSHRAKEHSKWHLGFTYTCKICGATFSKSTSHLTHIRLQHPSNNCCELCGESFIGEYGLSMHRKKAHRDQNGVKSDSLCVLCGVQFRSLDALNRHISAADNNSCDTSLRPCLSCGEGFVSDETLKEHLKIHITDDYVKCGACNRTFAHEKSYAIHYQRVHLLVKAGARRREDRVVCEICGKKCTSNATLVYHQRTHTGEKPYQCTKCPKRFSVCQLLQIHLRTHTGERPFPCARCPKAFKHKAALNRHDRVHTGAKPYACPHCGKSFSQSNSMKTHVNTVHLKLPAPYRHRRNKPE